MPKRSVKLSASTLTDLQSCALLYKFGKVERFVPVSKKERGLDYGGLFHYMLHPWRFGQIKQVREHHLRHPYSRLLNRDRQDLNRICQEIGRIKSFTTDLSGEDRNKVLDKFADYTTHYAGLGWEYLEVEQPFSIKIYEDDELEIIFQGVIDTLADVPKEGKTVVDTKTASRESYIPGNDNQLMGTAYAFNLKNFMIDRVYDRKDKPFELVRYSFLTEQKEEWLNNTVYWVKQGLFFETNNYYPPNPSSCRKWGGCRFMKVCESPPSARKFKLNSLFKKGEEHNIYKLDPMIPQILTTILGREENDAHPQVSEGEPLTVEK